jgi:hypothetical protein
VGKGVKVWVGVGGAKVGLAVPGAVVTVGVAETGRVTKAVGLGDGDVAVEVGVAVASPGAFRIAT